ncbi:DUF3618 domain-containing protein [Allokutzneria oryzae]|uniref:DUF3618 domain-containing protein n=1 Tax=Allokutzneria oryzae TaxID=1378989 RepID=A0ABV6A656_9PSEU
MTTKKINDAAETKQDKDNLDADELRDDILHTRAKLAGTVDALSYKLDVKNRAREKVQLAVGQVVEWARTLNGRRAAAIAAGVVAGVLALWLMRRKK